MVAVGLSGSRAAGKLGAVCMGVLAGVVSVWPLCRRHRLSPVPPSVAWHSPLEGKGSVETGQEGGAAPTALHPNQRFLATTLPLGLFWEL